MFVVLFVLSGEVFLLWFHVSKDTLARHAHAVKALRSVFHTEPPRMLGLVWSC